MKRWPFSVVLCLIAGVLAMFPAGCARSYTEVAPYESYNMRPTNNAAPHGDDRIVTLNGAVIQLPPDAAETAGPLGAPLISEAELTRMERNTQNGMEVLMRPRMRVSDEVTGRFRLGFEGSPSVIFLELTPHLLAGGQVALNARVEVRRDGGTLDSVGREQVIQANSGLYGVYGPLTMEGQRVYALLRADVR